MGPSPSPSYLAQTSTIYTYNENLINHSLINLTKRTNQRESRTQPSFLGFLTLPWNTIWSFSLGPHTLFAIRKTHAKNSYHMVCHHTLSKNSIISYQKIDISYPPVLFHTHTCHFIPAKVCFIRSNIDSYLYMSLYTSVVSYQNMSFHNPWYVIIPTIVISYHPDMSSTSRVISYRWNVCDQAHCTCVY